VDTLAREQQARQREELNMLYVAMTRAKHCLAISSVQPSNSAPGSWWNRLAPLMPEADAYADSNADEDGNEDGNAIGQAPPGAGAGAVAPAAPERFTVAALPALPEHLRIPSVPVAQPLATAGAGGGTVSVPGAAVPSTPASRMGEAMHQLLEQAGVAGAPLAQLREQGWPAIRVARLAQDFDITPDAARMAAQTAQRILGGEGAWAWEASAVDTAINEAPLRHEGQNLRLDRLVHCTQPAERAGWWVLDYKSAAEPERQPALLAQLQRYRDAVLRAMPGERVHAAFLTGDGRMVPAPVAGTAAAAASPGPVAAAPAKAEALRGSSAPESVQGSLF
jgi:ATP-dependent helicase/nuclease subunit A